MYKHRQMMITPVLCACRQSQRRPKAKKDRIIIQPRDKEPVPSSTSTGGARVAPTGSSDGSAVGSSSGGAERRSPSSSSGTNRPATAFQGELLDHQARMCAIRDALNLNSLDRLLQQLGTAAGRAGLGGDADLLRLRSAHRVEELLAVARRAAKHLESQTIHDVLGNSMHGTLSTSSPWATSAGTRVQFEGASDVGAQHSGGRLFAGIGHGLLHELQQRLQAVGPDLPELEQAGPDQSRSGTGATLGTPSQQAADVAAAALTDYLASCARVQYQLEQELGERLAGLLLGRTGVLQVGQCE